MKVNWLERRTKNSKRNTPISCRANEAEEGGKLELISWRLRKGARCHVRCKTTHSSDGGRRDRLAECLGKPFSPALNCFAKFLSHLVMYALTSRTRSIRRLSSSSSFFLMEIVSGEKKEKDVTVAAEIAFDLGHIYSESASWRLAPQRKYKSISFA
jgi:hypothetical protein